MFSIIYIFHLNDYSLCIFILVNNLNELIIGTIHLSTYNAVYFPLLIIINIVEYKLQITATRTLQ